MTIAAKNLSIKHVSGPLGVRGRNSDNNLLREKLAWAPTTTLRHGLEKTFHWINEQVKNQ
jgi:dTDP-D-glucose 4,6-dehydratase